MTENKIRVPPKKVVLVIVAEERQGHLFVTIGDVATRGYFLALNDLDESVDREELARRISEIIIIKIGLLGRLNVEDHTL